VVGLINNALGSEEGLTGLRAVVSLVLHSASVTRSVLKIPSHVGPTSTLPELSTLLRWILFRLLARCTVVAPLSQAVYELCLECHLHDPQADGSALYPIERSISLATKDKNEAQIAPIPATSVAFAPSQSPELVSWCLDSCVEACMPRILQLGHAASDGLPKTAELIDSACRVSHMLESLYSVAAAALDR
jgi:hypothetical protein